ncbi:hypothetical protein LTS12_028383, partial [Elasticomyces elasticus]
KNTNILILHKFKTIQKKSKPGILFLSLGHLPFFDELYDDLITRISQTTTIKRIKNPSAAKTYLDALVLTNPTDGTNNRRAILITDQALTDRRNKAILTKTLAYARAGGTVIAGFHFPSFSPKNDFDRFFNQGCGLPWKAGAYHRAEFEFNPSSGSASGSASASASALAGGGGGGGDAATMPGPYSMKALHVKNVRAEERVFVPIDGAVTQSHVFPAEEVDSDDGQAPVAGAKMGEQGGRLYYIGDVNAEVESTQVVLALCGLQP